MAYRMRSNVCMDSEARRPLPLEIWGTLSPSVQEYIQALQVQVQQLEGQVKELEARLGQNSQNSSRPPSSDSPRQKGPRGKKVPGRIRPLQAGSREDNLATRADTGPFTLWTRLMR